MDNVTKLRTTFLLSQIKNMFQKRKIENPILELNISEHKNILIIAPHPDDEVIGCGGIIQKYVSQKSKVILLFITVEDHRSIVKPVTIRGQNKRFLESKEAKKYLNYSEAFFLEIPERTINESDSTVDKIKSTILNLFEKERIDTVYIPNYFDLNPDHRIICKISLQIINEYVAHNNSFLLSSIFIFEVWGPVEATHVCYISKEEFNKKKLSMKCYETQMGSVDYIKIIDSIDANRKKDFQQYYPLHKQSSRKYSMEFFQLVIPNKISNLFLEKLN